MNVMTNYPGNVPHRHRYNKWLTNFLFTAIPFTIISQTGASPAASTMAANDQLKTLMKNYSGCWHKNDVAGLMNLQYPLDPGFSQRGGSERQSQHPERY